MKKVLFGLVMVFVCSGLFAQQRPVVAVTPFDAISGISETDANMITRVFNIRLGNTQTVTLVDRGNVDRILREHRFQAGDWSNQQRTVELGRALNADWIVRGEIESFGSNILVTVQFFDIQTFQFMGGSDILLANAEQAMERMDPLVNRLTETIAANALRAPVARAPATPSQTDAATFYGTWLVRNTSPGAVTLTIEANRVILRSQSNFGNFYAAISNPTWTAVNNNDVNTLTDYPRGFMLFGAITGNGLDHDQLRPIFVFMHRNDPNRLFLYGSSTGNSEIQHSTPWAGDRPLGRVQ
ncbi:MAG: hypothetical protein FWC97_08805 [Treponema sp.]|nr:hypothetical protein [Treponema sp.]